MNIYMNPSADLTEWLITEARKRKCFDRKGEASPGAAAVQILDECRRGKQ
jgi:hypothetical protein